MEDRPHNLEGQTLKIETGCGNLYVTINSSVDKPIFEVFAQSGKNGSCSAAVTDALTTIISVATRSGVNPLDIIEHIEHIKCPKTGTYTKSCPEAIAIAMQEYLVNNNYMDEIEENIYNYTRGEIDTNDSMKCESCGSLSVNYVEGCMTCMSCGWSACSV